MLRLKSSLIKNIEGFIKIYAQENEGTTENGLRRVPRIDTRVHLEAEIVNLQSER